MNGASYDQILKTNEIVNDIWYNVVVTYDSGYVIIYKDGEIVKSDTLSNSNTIPVKNNPLYLGSYITSPDFEGIMDEVRISNIVRSSAWVNASFDSSNQTTGFIVLGGEESKPVFTLIVLSGEYPVNGSDFFGMQPTVSFVLTNPSGEVMDYHVYVGNSSLNTSVLLTSGSGVGNGSVVFDNYYPATDLGESYWWRVMVNDSVGFVNYSYVFDALIGGGSVVSTPGFELLSFMSAFIVCCVILLKKKRGNVT